MKIAEAQTSEQRCSIARLLTAPMLLSFLAWSHTPTVEAGSMLMSDTNSGLAMNAYGGATHGAELKLVNNCTSENVDCTWTYRDGMLISDANPGLAVNAYGGAQHMTQLKLVNNCPPNNTDCTWTYCKVLSPSRPGPKPPTKPCERDGEGKPKCDRDTN